MAPANYVKKYSFYYLHEYYRNRILNIFLKFEYRKKCKTIYIILNMYFQHFNSTFKCA